MIKMEPTHIFIEITRRCNLNCRYCNRQQMNPEMKIKSLTIKQVRYIFDQFPRAEVINVIGSGEPFCYPEWKEFIEEFKKRRYSLLLLTSNGILMTDEIIDSLPSNTEIYFSIDTTRLGKSDPRQENVRLVMDNIRKLAKRRPEISIMLQRVFLKGTLSTVSEYLDFAKEVNAGVSFIFPLCYTKETFEEFYPSIEEKEDCFRLIEVAHTNGLRRINRFASIPKLQMCPDPFQMLFVGVTGDVWACCHMYSARPNIDKKKPFFIEYWDGKRFSVPSYQYKLGNIFKQTASEIFNGKKLDLIRKRLYQTSYDAFSRRKDYFFTEPYSYCDVCLWRWGCVG